MVSSAIYQYDLTIRRFLGPTLRLQGSSESTTLPGYPVPIQSEQSQTDFAFAGNRLVITTGGDGTIGVFPFDDQGLSVPTWVDLSPKATERRLAREKKLEQWRKSPPSGWSRSFYEEHEGIPFLQEIVALSDDLVVVRTGGRGHPEKPSSFYVVDLQGGKVIRTGTLPPGVAGMASAKGRLLLAVSGREGGRLVVLDEAFGESSSFALPGLPDAILSSHSEAVVKISEGLVSVNLDNGQTTDLWSNQYRGRHIPWLQISDGEVWWTVSGSPFAMYAPLRGGIARSVRICPDLKSIMPLDQRLYAICGNDLVEASRTGNLLQRRYAGQRPAWIINPRA